MSVRLVLAPTMSSGPGTNPSRSRGSHLGAIRVSGLNHWTVSWVPSVERPSRLWCQNPESI